MSETSQSSPIEPMVSNNLLLKLKQIKENREIAKNAENDENNIVHPTNMMSKIPSYNESEVIRKINSLQKEMDSMKGLLYKILSIVSKETEGITLETDD